MKNINFEKWCRAGLEMLFLAGLTWGVAGCMSAPAPGDRTQPWTPPKDAQKPDRVWKEIRSQQQDFSRPLTLAELTDLALQNNPASRKAWSDARVAAAQVEQARGYFLPTLTATANANRFDQSADPDSFDQTYTKMGPGLQVNYLVINFGGGRKAAVDYALQTVYAADFTFNRSLQDILLSVETAYYGLISAQAGVEAASASLDETTKALEAAQDRQASGVATRLDVLQAQAGHDQSVYNLAVAKGQFKIARGNLVQVLGIPANMEIGVVTPTNDVPSELTVPDLSKLIDEALLRRPDISALRATLAAKESAVKVAGSALWPSLYVNGALNNDYYSGTSGKDLQDSDWAYQAGLSLQWTLFDGLQTRAAKRGALAQLESTRAQLQQAELAASAEVWTRFANYETAAQKYTASSAYLQSATAAYELALDSYKSGLKSILDLLNAESQLAQARSQQIASRQDTFIALAQLAYSTGLLEQGGMSEPGELFSTTLQKDAQP
ncbi:MAG: TolC family protein [Lentisphaerota bacterium]